GRRKIKKAGDATPTPFEEQVAQEIYNIEANHSGMKADLFPLHITAAREITADGKTAVVLFVPYTQLADYHKIQKSLVEELEKKFTDSHVLIVANRTMLGKAWKRNSVNKGPIPRSRTLKVVQEALLDDVVFPSQIVGKQTVLRTDGSKTMNVFLDPKEQVQLENKLDTFSAVYKAMTSKDVKFQFASSRGGRS
ncbi:RPS7, partial [Symbiodinium sp. KB8]